MWINDLSLYKNVQSLFKYNQHKENLKNRNYQFKDQELVRHKEIEVAVKSLPKTIKNFTQFESLI